MDNCSQATLDSEFQRIMDIYNDKLINDKHYIRFHIEKECALALRYEDEYTAGNLTDWMERVGIFEKNDFLCYQLTPAGRLFAEWVTL